MFLLIRYQIVVASTKEINFTRQFSKVSLVHRTETNIARQFLEFCPFIVAVQQNFRDVSTNRLRNGSCAQFAANGKRKCWPFLRRQIYSAPGFWLLHQRQLLLLHLEQHPDRASKYVWDCQWPRLRAWPRTRRQSRMAKIRSITSVGLA